MSSKTRSSKIKSEPDTKSATRTMAAATKKVFLLPKHIAHNTEKCDWQLEYFQHPGTGQRALFLTSGKELLEVLQFEEPRRSWLIGSEICCNGRIYLTVPIDSTFLALHYVRKYCMERAMALDSIHDENDASAARLLTTFVDESKVRNVADVKTAGNVNYFKFNRDKTLAWLAVKTQRVAVALRSAGVHCGYSAKSQNYARSEKAVDETVNDMDFTRIACEIVGAYIELNLHEDLIKYLNIPSDVQAKVEDKKSIGTKRKTTQQLDGNSNKRAKPNADDVKTEKDNSLIDEELGTERNVSDLNISGSTTIVIKERILSTKEKALAKSAKGTKSIASFFKK